MNFSDAPQYIFACAGLIVLFFIGRMFTGLQKKSFDQIKEIQATNFEQTGLITKSTIENTQATTILAASTMGKEIVAGISPNLITHQAELVKINESIMGLKQEIKDRYDKTHEVNSKEFTRLFDEIKIAEGKIDLLLLANPAPPIPPGNLKVDLKVSEKLPV